MNARSVTLVFVILLVGSVPASIAPLEPAAAAESTGAAEPTASTVGPAESLAASDTTTGHPSVDAAATARTGDILHRTTTLRHRPTDTDVFEVETTFSVPDSVTELEIDFDDGATVESMTGFERTGKRTLEWTGATDEPTVRYTMPADRTGMQGTEAAGEGYSFVDTGEWAVVPVPDPVISLSGTDPVGVEEAVRIDGPGATGGDIAFFGAVTERERTVDGETFRLAIPEAATLEESPDAILSALADASRRLEVGMRSDEVFVVAAPTTVDWGPRGIQYGRSDAWVAADATLEEPNPVWFHEYVHVRQRFSNAADDTAPETTWLVEGQADYYAGLLALETGRTDFDAFSDLLERGERSPYADGVLTDRSTWEDDRTHYAKGALVYGELDRRLRLATDGDRTMADVFRRLNAREDEISEADLLRLLEEYGGADVRAAAERYTRTDATPEMWDRREHRAAFDQPVAVFEYGVGESPLEVAGKEWPRWNASEAGGSAGESDVIAVPAGEPVSIPVTVTNAGDREGTYDATVQVDGQVVDYRRGRLAPGADTSHRLSWTPPEPGEYTVRVGSERLTAVVRSAASVTVSDLRLSSETVAPGDSVTATATVEPAGERPAAAVIAFRTPDGVAAERLVALRPGESTTVEATLRFDERGRYEIVVGDRTVIARVDGDGPIGSLEEVPGFGASAALVALAIALAGALLGHRRS